MKKSFDKMGTIIGSDRFFLALGCLFSLLICMPYLILGENSIVSYHDQLDGELLTYLLNAKYLFQGMGEYPEIMGGISPNGVVSPAPLYILFYRLFSPFVGFMCSMLLNKVVGFLFLYLLIVRLTGRRFIAFFTGVWFVCLPFYPVYGLCIPGQPMLFYALLRLWELGGEKAPKKQWIIPIILILFYGAASSLALCGFTCLTVILFLVLAGLLRGKGRQTIGLMVGGGVLAVTYAVFNLSLIKQLLPFARSDFQTHKSEMRVSAAPFWNEFFSVFLNGEDYCNAFAVFILPVVAVSAISLILYLWKLRVKGGKLEGEMAKRLIGQGRSMFFLLIGLVMIAFWRALYQSKGFVATRNMSKGVWHEFNFGRFTWLMPFLWCLVFALACDILLVFLQLVIKEKGKQTVLCAARVILCLAALLPAGMGAYRGDLKPNVVKLLRGGDYYMLTWKQFFAQDLYDEADKIIGRPKEDYRIVSLGIYPAAASYNGFYCLDAYSNNYDLEYKHQFRRIIAPQLEKSDYLREWFDDWGNRCYMLLAQFGNYFTCEKKWGAYTDEYEFDLNALKEMGGEYIISAIYLNNWQGSGLRLLNEEPIQTQDSWYRLWVYEID